MNLDEEVVLLLHEKIAETYWKEAGCPMDNDINRQLNDWYRARRDVAFILADLIIENCKDNECFDFPPIFYDYLNDLSLDKYKEIKAYCVWAKKGKVFQVHQEERDKDYLEACNVLDSVRQGCKKDRVSSPCNDLFLLLQNKNKTNIEKIKKRKAYWSFLKHQNFDFNKHWDEVSNYVTNFYNILQNHHPSKLAKSELQRIASLIENHSNHHIANMSEFILRCDLKIMARAET